jgi:polysaccharide pyruvyl transferase WcaK-like protein
MNRGLKKQLKPILLLGAYGRGNIGDDIFSICAAQLFSGHPVYINSAHDNLLPEEVRGKIKTISTIHMSDLVKKLRLFWHISHVVYWGGDLWVLLYGNRVPRQILYKMLVVNTLLRLSGKKVYYIGCGIGDLHGYSLWLARMSARMAKLVVVREYRSANKLAFDHITVLPDIAINLPYIKPRLHKPPHGGRQYSIVISILWSIPKMEQNFPKLIKSIAEMLDNLPAHQYKLTLLPMQISHREKLPDDLWALEQLAKLIQNHDVSIYTQHDVDTVCQLLSDAHLVLGTRLHACILSVLSGTPTIGIAYRQKVTSYFKDNGLSEYCIDLETLDKLTDIFNKINDNYKSVSHSFFKASKNNLRSRKAYRELINQRFD